MRTSTPLETDRLTVGRDGGRAYYTLEELATYLAGVLPGGASDVIVAAAPNQNFAVNSVTPVTIVSESVAGLAAGDSVELELWYTINNNSGAVRTYSCAAAVGSLGTSATDGTTTAAAAATRTSRRAKVRFSLSATNLAYIQLSQIAYVPQNADTTSQSAGALIVGAWDSTSSDLTGTQTVSFTVTSSNATATQTLTLHSYTIRKVSAT